MTKSRTERRSTRAGAGDVSRVLVVYKKSAYQTNVRERKNPRFLELLARKDPSVARLVEAHEDHQATLEEAHEALHRLGVRATFRFRGDEGLVEDVDLVVTIGGDGTLLWAARWIGIGTPVIAINSAPRDSVGHFCGGKKGHVRSILGKALEGSLRRTELTRMQVELDDEIVTRRVLNDVLFAHPSPAATSRYLLTLEPKRGRGRTEEQKSSGVWVGPAAGSTAAQLSAGGNVLPVASKKLQFVVREPYQPGGRRIGMPRGLIADGGCLRMISKIREGRLFIDGPHRIRDVRMGSEIVLSRSNEPLTVLALPRAAR